MGHTATLTDDKIETFDAATAAQACALMGIDYNKWVQFYCIARDVTAAGHAQLMFDTATGTYARIDTYGTQPPPNRNSDDDCVLRLDERLTPDYAAHKAIAFAKERDVAIELQYRNKIVVVDPADIVGDVMYRIEQTPAS